jgi:hypothetical protein
MKKTLITVAVAGVAAIAGGLLLGLDPVETFKFIAGMFVA